MGVFDDASTIAQPRVVAPATASFSVVVVAGAGAGARLEVAPERSVRALVGQSPSCDLRLDDRRVSRRHLALEVVGDRLRVVDLASTNGTRVTGVAIERALLTGGERIELGDSVLLVERLGASGAPPPPAHGFGRTLGGSPAMRRLYPLAERLARSNVSIVIEGETGTGKEVLAESLHEEGPRAAGPFVVFDCTAVAPTLVESALFGHERGSFTGATETRHGVFEEAHGGTLLIDEIGDLPLPLQAKLLRALERSEVRRVGSNKWIKVDVRVMSATRRDLDAEVAAGRFRDDLYFRLAVARIELPPLRQRQGDVALLAEHFWSRLGGRGPLPADWLERLEAYDWPGNIRELHNAVARRVALGAIDVPEAPTDEAAAAIPEGDALGRILALDLPLPRARELAVQELERRYLTRVLERHGGSVAKAAAASGIARRYFQLLRARQRKREEP